MVSRIFGVCVLGVLAAAGSALAASAATARAATSPAPRMDEAIEAPALACVRGFSKDYCNGVVTGGEHNTLGCPTSPVPSPCNTLFIKDATYAVDMFSNNQVCGPTLTSTCDEAVNGTLKVVSNFTIRLHRHCPFRGSWDGTYAEYQGADGSVYQGILLGTLGVGTHRPSTTPTICAQNPGTRDCERCYDVSFDPATSQWRIGYEATFRGKRAEIVTGEELTFSLSGDFFIAGDQAGPRWTHEWQVNGTADGVRLTFCP